MTEINKKHTLFGDRAERVSSDEMKRVFYEFDGLAKNESVVRMALTKSLPQKTTHGDVDIVYVPMYNFDVLDGIKKLNGDRVLDSSRNGDVLSVLFRSDIGKDVHVDFIKATVDNFKTKLQYFSYNDFSGVVGMLSKKLHFKYGSEGFFKRFRDKRGNWHDILISYDLMVGLEILGFDVSLFNKIKTVDDIVDFMLTSPLFDSYMVSHGGLNQPDRKSYKRPVIKYIVDRLRETEKIRTHSDEDFYFRSSQPGIHLRVSNEMVEIDANLARKSNKYNGDWVMKTLDVKPGPFVGEVLKYLSDLLGEDMDVAEEKEMERLAKTYLKMNPQ